MNFFKTKKQKIIAGSVVAVLVIGVGTTVALVNHYNQVKAEQVQKAYDDLKENAEKAVKQAENFKAEGDVAKANEAIKRLQSSDQKGLFEKAQKLTDLWKSVNVANEKVMTAEKSKDEGDVASAQKAITELKDEKQADLKEELQKRLDNVKQSIQKAKDDKAKIEADKKAQNKANAEDTPMGNTYVQGGEVSAYNAGGGAYAPQGNTGGTPPANNGGNRTSIPAQAPAAPPTNGGGMGSGLPDRNGGKDLAQNENNAQNADWNW